MTKTVTPYWPGLNRISPRIAQSLGANPQATSLSHSHPMRSSLCFNRMSDQKQAEGEHHRTDKHRCDLLVSHDHSPV